MQLGIFFALLLVFGALFANDRTHDDHGSGYEPPKTAQMC